MTRGSHGVVRRDLIILPVMKRTAHLGRVPRASALRRMFMVFLAFAYVVVGIVGEVSCAEETLEIANATIATASDVNATTEKSDEGSKKTLPVVEHCYTCVPLLVPAPLLVAEPSAEPVRLSFRAPVFVLEDHPRLDTPPPKHLT
jgi:hypothetical protein